MSSGGALEEPTARNGGAAAATSDAPDLGLDELLSQLIGRAQEFIAAQERLRGLLRANRVIVGDLTLPVVLRRIIETARDLIGARYAALGVLSNDGGLEQFIHVGLDDHVVAEIGRLPEGKGLLGALIDDPHPIRLGTIADDPRSVGFPEHHPPMSSFLGVPIRIRNEVFGNLYFTESERGQFSADDEELASSLAATAATAIENARLYEESRRRQQWLQASTEITRQLLSSEGESPLQVIARRLHEMAEADVVTVVLPTPDEKSLMLEVATGERAADLTATSYPVEGTLSGMAITGGRPVLIGDVTEERQYKVHLSEVMSVGPLMAIPLVGAQRTRGALMVARLHGRHRFNEADLEMATTFAQHAAVALELADARADQQRVILLEDRDRIARDLHDHVIQRLFAAGLSVQSVASGLGGDHRSERLAQVVDDIDDTIRQIRTSIFELRGALGPQTVSLRSRLLDVAADLTQALGFSPRMGFTGPVDVVVPESLGDDVVAVVREALTNCARHAHAQHVEVEVTASTAELSIDVLDDGVGMGDAVRRSGLANLRERAERHGGGLTTPDHKGTHLRWTIPLN
jgi:signal transduction histidine kinase